MSSRLTAADVQSRPGRLRDKLIEFEKQIPGATVFTVGAEASNVIVVAIQLKENASLTPASTSNVNLTAPARVAVWISDTAGGVPSATAPNAATSITVGTVLAITTAKVLFDVVSTAAGAISLSIGETTAKSFYVNVARGGVVTSKIVTFA